MWHPENSAQAKKHSR